MSNVIVPVSDFAALVTRLEALEAKVAERLVDGVYKYGPCLRCGYGPWDSSHAHEPRCCPRCHSAYWNTTPKRSFARTPDDPPLATWDPSRKVKIRKSRASSRTMTVAEVERETIDVPRAASTTASTTSAASRTVILPPELRPPGEPLIPPPPRVLPDVVAARTVDNPMNVRPVEIAPTEHVAAMPEAIVEAILSGESVTYEDIKAAKEDGDAITDPVDPAVPEAVREEAPRPTNPSLQAKKDAFFADAIAAGLVAPVAEREAAPPTTPFVSGTETPSLAPVKDDDPFWK